MSAYAPLTLMVDNTGATDCYEHFKEAFRVLPNGWPLEIPPGRYLIDLKSDRKPLGVYGDNANAATNQHSIGIYGHVSTPGAASGTVLDFRVTNPKTSVGTYISKGMTADSKNGQRHWRMGGWSGLNQNHVGMVCLVRGCKNAGWWMISGVHNGGTEVSLYNSYNTDFDGGEHAIHDDTAASGGMEGEIFRYGMEICSRTTRLSGLHFTTSGSGRLYSLLAVRNSGGVDASPLTQNTLSNIVYSPSSANNAKPYYGLAIGLPYMPEGNSQTFTASVLANKITGATFDALTPRMCRFSSTATLPSPLVAGTAYYLRRVGAKVWTIHPTSSDASAGTSTVLISDTGTGTHTITVYNQYYAETADDGTSSTLPRVADTAKFGNGNVSEGRVERNTFYPECWFGSVLHGSPSGQSVNWDFNYNYWLNTVQGYIESKRWNGNAHANFYAGTWGSPGEGFCIEKYGSNRNCNYVHQYYEAWGSLLYYGGIARGAMGTKLSHCHLRGGSPHLIGTTVYAIGQGPIEVSGGVWGNFDAAANTDCFNSLVLAVGGTTNEPVVVNFNSVKIFGKPQADLGQPARLIGSYCRGVYKFSGNEELDIEEKLPGGGRLAGADALAQALSYISGVFTDVTSALNSATNADVALGTASGDVTYFGYSQRFCGLLIDNLNGRAGVAGTGEWEFMNASGTWTAFSSVTDETVGFTATPADGRSVIWRMPSHANTANAWAAGSVNGSVDRYWVRFRVTSTYSVAPILDQAFVDHKKVFTFTEQDFVDACSNAAKHMPSSGKTTNPIPVTCSGALTLPLFGSGADRLKEIWLVHICRAINYQANLYEWNIAATFVNDQTQFWLISTRQGRWATGTDVGTTAQLRFWSHARAGKVDISGSDWLACGAGTVSGWDAYQSTIDTGGAIVTTNVGDIKAELESEVSFFANKCQQLNGTQVPLQHFVGRAYGTGASFGGTDAIQRKMIDVTIGPVAGRLTWRSPNYSTTEQLDLPRAKTSTLDIATRLPPNSRFEGTSINVTTRVQNGGNTDVTTCDVGISGTADKFAKAVSLKTTGEKSPGAYTGVLKHRMNGTSTVQLQLRIDSTANLDTLTAGVFTIEVFYRVLP